MTPHPTLDYATPSRSPRLITLCYALLITLGVLYAFVVLSSVAGAATDAALKFSDLLIIAFVAISDAFFFIAAFKIRRPSRHWAGIALITTLVNLAALISCLGWTYLTQGITDPGDILLGCVSLLPIAALVALAPLLSILIRELKRNP